jgi:Flp pilus assembly protein TadD
LALAMMLRTAYQESTEDPAYQQSRRLATEAIALDPDTAEAHEVLGYLAMHQDWNFELAEQELRSAVELNAFDVPTRTLLATLLSYEGAGAESLQQLHAAQQQAPDSRYLMHNEVLLLSNAGRLPEMLTVAKKAAKRFPDDPNIQDQYGWALWYNREYVDAVQAWISKARLEHNSNVEQFETAALAVLRSRGMPAYAELKVAAIRQQKLSATTKNDEDLAEWYIYANQPEQALDALEQAYQHRDSTLLALKADPVYASLHGEKRYEDLLAKMHLDREPTPYSNSVEMAANRGRDE